MDTLEKTEDEPIRVVAYDPRWPALFDAERVVLTPTLAPWTTGGIHHVGSTAVPGLAAKPVIDILVGVGDLESSRASFDALAALEYHYAPYRSIEMHWFCKPSPLHRTHHVHLVPTGSERYRAELAFRDALRADPKLAAEYAELKRGLALEHARDREAYAQAKAKFIERGWPESPRNLRGL
jgi:GrpB-like predicted nucleotidyltransferase (UPF0157 family)